ncbi:MAG TPA: discoidin domain-containing protein, partial [Spirochaetota bacterium]
MHIQISCRQIHKGVVSSFSSEEGINKASHLMSEEGAWQSKKSDSVRNEHITIDYSDNVLIDQIVMYAGPSGPVYFPSQFRFESSTDGKEWQIIHAERNFQTEEKTVTFSVPLFSARYLRLSISRQASVNSSFSVEIGKITAGIAGIRECLASSVAASDRGPVKLFDADMNGYWESAARTNQSKESLDIDLGQTFVLNKITLASHIDLPGFPEQFSIEASSDRKVWIPLVDEKRFRAENGQKYAWGLDAVNARYVRTECSSVKIAEGNFTVRIAKMGIFAAQVDDSHAHTNSGNPPHASIFQGGLVRLAKDGEDAKGAAVQASDRRLRDGSTRFKGILQIAENGESKEGLVVQSSDDRLKEATETRAGIVRLAYDGERKAGAVVQGSDPRLKEASESSFGIVRLCPNGALSETGVVRGNDERLKNASTANPGIVRLASNGEEEPNCVVQGNDKRLKDASIAAKGIVELAEDGEDRAGVVVQGNDKRLKKATQHTAGIIELAEDGEDQAGTAVQGNDRRLKDATVSTKGIVELAEDGEDRANVAVQGNDKRLKDATTSTRGIVELAEDGEDRANVVVQGNDKRLKDATDFAKGVLRFAQNGEDAANAAVQGNDKRLKDATVSAKGIVELAEDGEDRANVAVQGNDKRLKDATVSAKGIVELAEDGE